MKELVNISIFVLFSLSGCSQKQDQMKFKKLTYEEERIIINKGTEKPFTGKYYDHFEQGIYVCKRCEAPLYKSSDKFNSHCGWPSFDDEMVGAVKHLPDADGIRTEILCNTCGAHLGHVFTGEWYTKKNIRHCVNSISLDFIPLDKKSAIKTDTAIFAGGCFWGVEYFFQDEEGVVNTVVGYTGGQTKKPTYKEVCSHNTGHVEAIQVIFNPSKTSYEKLAKLFFEIHDPTQLNRQGPDTGEQYRSEIFYLNGKQKEIAEKLIEILKQKGYNIVTKLTATTTFWKAEDYHQKYYENKGTLPYCHGLVKRF